MTATSDDTDKLNIERAARCLTVLFSYTDFDPRTNLIDLLTDAMHWCRLNREDFDQALTMAREHFDAEAANPNRKHP